MAAAQGKVGDFACPGNQFSDAPPGAPPARLQAASARSSINLVMWPGHGVSRTLALFISLLALGAACSEEGEATDGLQGTLPRGTFGAGTPSRAVSDDGGASSDGGAAPDLRKAADGGARPDGDPGSVGGPPVEPCRPSCTGLTCGSPDGCGGICLQACDCVPTCSPEDCWTSNGCGGLCIAGCADQPSE